MRGLRNADGRRLVLGGGEGALRPSAGTGQTAEAFRLVFIVAAVFILAAPIALRPIEERPLRGPGTRVKDAIARFRKVAA